MQKNLQGFLFQLFVYSVILYLAFLLVKDIIPVRYYYADIHYLFAFFITITTLFHAALLYASGKNSRSIVSFYMLGTALKFLTFIAIMIGYVLLNRDNAKAFISNFFALYLFYMIFEAIILFRKSGRNMFSHTENNRHERHRG